MPLPDSKHQEKEIRVGWKMAGLGGETASYVAAGLLLGWGFSEWFGSDVWLVVGGIAGTVTGMVALVRGALKLNKEMDRLAGVRDQTAKKGDSGFKRSDHKE